MVSSKRYKKLASPISLRLSIADYGKEDARERQFVMEAEGKETISETSSRQPLRVRIDGSGFLKSVDTGLFVLDGNGNRVSASNIASLLLEHDVTVLA